MKSNPGWRAKPLTLGYYISRPWRGLEFGVRRSLSMRMKLLRSAFVGLVCMLLFSPSSSGLVQGTQQTAQSAGPEKIVR